MAVFDLDGTLWDKNCQNFEQHVRVGKRTIASLSRESHLELFPGVEEIFVALHRVGVPIAIASASPAHVTAKRILHLFGLASLVSQWEVYPTNRHRKGGQVGDGLEIVSGKQEHCKRISKEQSCALQKLLFFDDLPQNIRDVSRLGCTSVLVRGGIKPRDVIRAIYRMRAHQKGADFMRNYFKPSLSSTGTSATDGVDSSSIGCRAKRKRTE